MIQTLNAAAATAQIHLSGASDSLSIADTAMIGSIGAMLVLLMLAPFACTGRR